MSGLIDKVKAKAQTALSSSSTPQTHQAAILPEKGARLQVQSRPTPTPGATELLIQVKSVALNPVDYYQRDFGFNLTHYPGVLGSDVGGIVSAVGSSVSHFKSGDRVTAFAPAFDKGGHSDYGAFQEYVLVPAAYAAKVPDSMNFNEAAILPMAVETVMAGWYSIGMPTKYTVSPADKKAMLVWGGSSSVGSAAVQIAREMGYTVFATASEKHHQYIRSLGASHVFDYKDADVVSKIIQAAKDDGVALDTAYDAAGALQQILDILKAASPSGSGKVASAIPLKDDRPTADGIEVKFVMAPADKGEREKWAAWVFGEWLEQKLENKNFVPSPRLEVFPGGLEAMNDGLDRLKAGVSATKLVIEI